MWGDNKSLQYRVIVISQSSSFLQLVKDEMDWGQLASAVGRRVGSSSGPTGSDIISIIGITYDR